MPIVVGDTITRPEELVTHLADIIENNPTLEFKYISRFSEQLIPEYPCCQIQAGPLDREFHSTHTFELYLTAFIYVMHDTLTESKRVRSENDLLFATSLADFLESDMKLGGRIINGFVANEVPAVVPPHSPKTPAMVSTRLTYVCRTQKRFK